MGKKDATKTRLKRKSDDKKRGDRSDRKKGSRERHNVGRLDVVGIPPRKSAAIKKFY